MSDFDAEVTDHKCRSILEMPTREARRFLLKQKSYCKFDLPEYFCFDGLLKGIDRVLEGKSISELRSKSPGPRDFDDVNHLILDNKDGRHAWRPQQLIHPALYVSLVHHITDTKHWRKIRTRFAKFRKNPNICCLSMPVESLEKTTDKAEQIRQWWSAVEQESLSLALDYKYIIHSDITDCYSQIYTHSIAWAIHTKTTAKKKENRYNHSLLGNIIDDHIQDMRHGQTNGIPQGSVLMDLIAEMVLGYADLKLTQRINKLGIENYKILRYRDDYRIFVNNPQDGEQILKCLTEVMIGLGLKLNPSKTHLSDQVVRSSIKEDKIDWMCRKQSDESLQKHLLIIHNHSVKYPNGGSLMRALSEFHKRIYSLKKHPRVMPLVSIIVDIAYCNPRTYSVCVAILTKLISLIDPIEEKVVIVEKIKTRFSELPNTGHMQIWLQRISLLFAPEIDFDEPLCRLINDNAQQVWNSDWISSKRLKRAVSAQKIISRKALAKLEEVESPEKVELFAAKAEYVS